MYLFRRNCNMNPVNFRTTKPQKIWCTIFTNQISFTEAKNKKNINIKKLKRKIIQKKV